MEKTSHQSTFFSMLSKEYIADTDKLIKLSQLILPDLEIRIENNYKYINLNNAQIAFTYLIALYILCFVNIGVREAESSITKLILQIFDTAAVIDNIDASFVDQPDFKKPLDKESVFQSMKNIYSDLVPDYLTEGKDELIRRFIRYFLESMRSSFAVFPLEEALPELTATQSKTEEEQKNSDPIQEQIVNKFSIHKTPDGISISINQHFAYPGVLLPEKLKDFTLNNLRDRLSKILLTLLEDKKYINSLARLINELLEHITSHRNAAWRGIDYLSIEIHELEEENFVIEIVTKLKQDDSRKITAYTQYARIVENRLLKGKITQLTNHRQFEDWQTMARQSYNEEA
ncbi:MAG: hypothetical protein ABI721_00095 [Candidatus Dojkabacteria bacterium]